MFKYNANRHHSKYGISMYADSFLTLPKTKMFAIISKIKIPSHTAEKVYSLNRKKNSVHAKLKNNCMPKIKYPRDF